MVGIYRIKNLINNKCYYGSSKEVEKRWSRHKSELNKNRHHNIHLQRAWDKYGKTNFLFEIVETCKIKELLVTEQKYLDSKPEYNIGLIASGGDNITSNPNRSVIIENMTKSINARYDLMSDEEKIEKFSRPKEKNNNWKGGVSFKYCDCGTQIAPINKTCVKCRDKSGVNNPFYGKKHTDETKNKLRILRLGKKPGNIKKVTIDCEEYESLTEAENITGISKSTILWRIKSKNKKYNEYNYA